VREALQRGDQPPLGFDLASALRAGLSVRRKWRHAKAFLAVNEEVDFVR
jgi:hypothetical protein